MRLTHLVPFLPFAVLGLAVGCGGGTTSSTNATDAEALQVAQELGIDPALMLANTNPATGLVTICHYPPGNRANMHTITVGPPAVVPHVRLHKDTVGPCKLADGGILPPPGNDSDGGEGNEPPPPPPTGGGNTDGGGNPGGGGGGTDGGATSGDGGALN